MSKIVHLNIWMIVLLLFSCLIMQGYSEQYELPPYTASQDKYIRLNEIQELHEPQIFLNRIYRRQVYKVISSPSDQNSSMIAQFAPCKESPPQVSFKNTGYYHLDQPLSSYSQSQQVTNSTQAPRKFNTIIYDYDALKAKYQNIVDMIYDESQIYTISSTGIFSVYRLTSEVDNGIQLKSTVKGIDWDWLYQYRYENWKIAEKKEKQRLELIEQKRKKQLQNNTSTDNSTLLGQQNQISQQQSNNQSNSKSNDTTNTTRKLSEVNFVQPSPKVKGTEESAPSPKVKGTDESVPKQKQSNSASTQNSSQPAYYTVPAPQQVKSHLQKGYFQLMDHNNLLIFANNDYLIGYDIGKNQSILLSEQLQFDYLFPSNRSAPSQNKTTLTNKTTNDTNSTTVSNQTDNEPPTPAKQTDKTVEPDPNPEPDQIIMPEYISLSQFEEITKINQTHFAIIDRKKGIFIYEITKRKPNNYTFYSNNPSNYVIRKTSFIGKQQFGKSYQQHQQMNLIDIEFFTNKSLLIVLDYQKGIFAFEQPIYNTSKNNTQLHQRQPSFVISSYVIIKKMCNLMQFSQISQTLYLSCNKIFRISLEKWPKITQKTFQHPLINIRQIFVAEEMDIFILSGYSVFKVMYLDRTTNYFQDDMLDKIIFSKDFAITANENHIIALKYKVQKPAIYCQASNKSFLGTHSLMLKTTAQCSPQYLKSINFTKPQNQPFDNNDICVYTVYKNIYIWQQGEVPLKPLAIVMLVFLIFIVVMIIWFVLIKFRMQRVNQHIKYLSEQGHKTLVEEQQPKEIYSSDKQSEKDDGLNDPEANGKTIQSTKRQEQDPNKDLYSIE